ncbi:MAG: hypothetical protein E4H14_09560 [Candidatus Thorarchaeota archaeon]|nr:MAG: hypothetical protein E4H14_09560 [Candidatus Thorarchaeota archaeon]
MKIVDRILDIFGKRRALLIGATTQPNDIMAHLYAVRASTCLKITGKVLPTTSLPKTGAEDLTGSLSPSRRLLRKDF